MEPKEINELDITEQSDTSPVEASEAYTEGEADIEPSKSDAEYKAHTEKNELDGETGEGDTEGNYTIETEGPDSDTSLIDTLEGDYDELTAEFPELLTLGDISKMEGAIRYGELRELGLSPREAYLATRKKVIREASARAHLTPVSPRAARRSGLTMPRAELKIAREIFVGLSDSEIETLYKKVTRT